MAAFGQAFAYDTAYAEELLRAAPGAYVAFQRVQDLVAQREALPLEQHFVARIATMQGADCGACGQLNLRMALQAGVDRALLETLVERPDDLPEPHADIRRHALAVARGELADGARVERLRRALGRSAFAELAAVIAGCTLYPTLKRALDFRQSCEPLHLDPPPADAAGTDG